MAAPVSPEPRIARKLTVRAHGARLVLVKGPNESLRHVLMKAGLWALLLPDHPGLAVERSVGDRFKPDLVALDAEGRPTLWAEAGALSPQKITSLARRFREARFVFAKWGRNLAPHEQVVRRALRDLRRPPPIELVGFPTEPHRILGDDGHVVVRWSDVARVEIAGGG